MPKPLISPYYAELNQQLHDSRDDYGSSNAADIVAGIESILAVAKHFGATNILDFGSGKGVRAQKLREAAPGLTVYEFDPAVPGKETLPPTADMVIAMDVMEHIEMEYLDNALETICELKPKVFVAMISLVPAAKTLPDGRNAHLILETPAWWKGRISRYFNILTSQPLTPTGHNKPYAMGIVAEPIADQE